VKNSIVLVAIAALYSMALPARASYPKYVRLSYGQPDATTSIGVAWNSDAVGDGSLVEYGKDATYGQSFTGTALTGQGPLGAIHEATLTGLEPATTYHFRVGGAGGWSLDRTFRTAPADPCAPLSFVVLGDDRSDDNSGASPRWPPIFEEALSGGPLFVLNTGDIVRDGSEANQWNAWLGASGDGLSAAAHMPTIGNHDDGPGDGDTANYNQIFNLPRNDVTNTEDYYYFTTGSAIVVSLSTQTYKDFGAQAAWLDKVLTENPRTWRFVFFHHPTYTSSSLLGLLDISHPPNEEHQNAAYTAVFDKHHVDFVFYGHNHFYERFQPMKGNGDGDEGIPVGEAGKGTYYVVAGGAGAITYNIATILFCGTAKGSAKCSGNHHYVRLDLDGNKLTYLAHSTAQQLLGKSPSNSFAIETFAYQKAWPGEDPCLVPPVEPGPEPVADAAPEPVPEVTPEPAIEPQPETVAEAADFAEAPADAEPMPEETVAEDLLPADTAVPTPDASIVFDIGPADAGTGTQPVASGGCGAGTSAAGGAAFAAFAALLAIRPGPRRSWRRA
jgi:hypothetical protein